MSKAKILTKTIAEQFLKDEQAVHLSEFTSIEPDAAERLSNRVEDLDLGGDQSAARNRGSRLGKT